MQQSRRREKLETSETTSETENAAAAAAVWEKDHIKSHSGEGIMRVSHATYTWSTSKFKVAAAVTLSKCIPPQE